MTLLLRKPNYNSPKNPNRSETIIDYKFDHLSIDDNNTFKRRADNIHPFPGTASVDKDFLLDLSTKEGTGTVSVEDKYGNVFKMSVISAEEELRRAVGAMKKVQIAYKYYSVIWMVCAIFVCFFVMAGISGILGPLSSGVGAVFSCAGIIGARIDWKDWSKKHADQSFTK